MTSRSVDWCNLIENWPFQNLLLSKGLISLIRTDDRPIVPHYSFITFQKWMYTYPNDSIIVINYSAHVICTIWKSLKVFCCFYEWIPLTHFHTAHTPVPHSKTCPTHPSMYYNPLTYSYTANTPIRYPHTTREPLTHPIFNHVNTRVTHMSITHLWPT